MKKMVQQENDEFEEAIRQSAIMYEQEQQKQN